MTTTINKEEIQKFSKLADEWWDVNGKFKPLHMFNPIRIEYITDKIKQHFKINADNLNYLKGLLGEGDRVESCGYYSSFLVR